ncbi:MAG: hypothetical protein R3C05_31095 [Pirellulaceae bacterium]
MLASSAMRLVWTAHVFRLNGTTANFRRLDFRPMLPEMQWAFLMEFSAQGTCHIQVTFPDKQESRGTSQ